MNPEKKKKEEPVNEVGVSKLELVQVQASLEECKAALAATMFNLGERRKELHCQNMMSEIFSDLSLELDEICVKVLEQIPPAWQFPEKTGAMITLEGKVFKTPGYQAKSPQLEHDIVADSIAVGKVLISLIYEKSKDAADPFLPEESELIKSIALRLGNVIALKKREMARRKGEALYHSILSASPDVITITDLEGKILFSSERAVKMFGASSSEDFPGHKMFEYIDPLDHERASGEIAKMLAGQLAGAAEYTALRADGNKFDIEVNGEFIRNENGLPVQMIFVTRDITDRKNAERKLARTEERFKGMIENLNDVVYEISIDGTVTYVSPSIERFVGYKPEELVGRNFFSYMHEDDRALIRQKLEDIVNKDHDFLEYRYYAKNGGIKWVRSSTTPIYEDGKLTGGRGVLIDVTERKHTENALRESEMLYKSLVNTQTNYVLRTDLHGKHTYWNRKFEEEFGWIYYKQGIANADSMQSICDYHHQRTVEVVNECLCSPGKIVKVELDKPAREGGIRTTLWEFICLTDLNGNPAEIQCMGIDITELKKAEHELQKGEEKYRSLIDSADATILLLDREGRYQYINTIGAQGLGLPAGKILGKRIHDLFPPDVAESIMSNVDFVFSENAGRVVEEQIVLGGQRRWYRTSTQPVRDESGVPVSALLFASDITGRKEAELLVSQSEQKYRALFEYSPDGYLIFQDGIFVECNKASERLVGGSRTDIIGKRPDEISPEFQPNGKRSFDYVIEVVNEAFATGKNEFEWTHRRIDGADFLALIHLAPVQYEGRDALLVSWKDVTLLKEADNKVKKSEEKYRSLFDFSPDGYLIVKDGIYVECNKAAEVLAGGDRSRIIGASPDMLSPEIQPGGRRSDELAAERIRETLEKGKNTFEWVHKRFDGSEFIAMVNLAAIDYEGGKAILVTWKDITALRQTELAIRKSEEKYRLMFETIRDVFYEADLDGNILEISPSVKILSKGQFTREELIGQSLFSFYLNTEDRDRFLKKLSEKGTIDDYEVMLRNKDGSIIPVSLSSGFLYGQDGKPLKIAGSVRDITERLRSDEEIRKFRTIADKANYGMAIAALDGTMLYSNEYFARMHGWEVSEVIGKNLSMFHSDQQMVRVLETVGLLQKNGEFQAEEVWRTRKDGSAFPSLMNAIVVYNNGIPQYMSATAIDITEIKEKEKEIRKLNLAIEQSPVSIVITDLKANIEYASPAFYNITGYTFEEVKGKNVNLLKSGKTPDSVYRDLWGTITEGKPWQGEWVNRRKDGSFYWESINITPVLDENNKISSYLAVKQDISERKRAEQEIMDLNANLEQKIADRTAELALANDGLTKEIEERKQIEEELKTARKEAEGANQAKSEFLSRMSHELRTPMNSILGFAQLLQRGDLNPGQKKGVSHILRSGKHLLELINEILDISRIEAGRISFSPEPVQLNGVITEMIDIVHPQVNARQITLEIIQSDAMQLSVKSDRQRLKQILLNLINNAIKYNVEGGSIWINAELLPLNSQGWVPVRISVKDTGRGIHPEDLYKLFVPFERIGAENTETEGTGLGLAVVKKLLDLMGGLIGVESTPGVGSTFWIEMPLTESQMEPIKNGSLTLDVNKLEDHWDGTILYVEDNKPNIDLVNDIIDSTRPGIKLITTMYGRQAAKLAREHNPDLVLLDLNLPDIHGAEVLKILKSDENTRKIPILVITADAVPDHIKPLLKEGAMDCLIKPLEIDNFLRILDKIFYKI
ncbi:MAG: PAS domain S-box protein [Bacteroidota bacterium]